MDTLLHFGADVCIVARELSSRLSNYEKGDRIKVLDNEFHEDQLEGIFLVIAATNDPDLNHRVSKKAEEKGLLINAVDQPADCNFIVPSIVSRGDLQIAVSTSGKSPALAKKIRKQLEKAFGIEYEFFLNLMGYLRKEILSQGLSSDENMRIFQDLVDSNLLAAIEKREWGEVLSMINAIIPGKLSQDDLMALINER